MATGFVQRFKGKVAFPLGGIYIAGTQVNASGADFSAITGQATVSTKSSTETLNNGGVNQILSTAAALFRIADPVKGRYVAVQAMVGTTGWRIAMSSLGAILGGSTLAGGSTSSWIFGSTVSFPGTVLEMVGLSTSQYLFLGYSPSTLSHILFSSAT